MLRSKTLILIAWLLGRPCWHAYMLLNTGMSRWYSLIYGSTGVVPYLEPKRHVLNRRSKQCNFFWHNEMSCLKLSTLRPWKYFNWHKFIILKSWCNINLILSNSCKELPTIIISFSCTNRNLTRYRIFFGWIMNYIGQKCVLEREMWVFHTIS